MLEFLLKEKDEEFQILSENIKILERNDYQNGRIMSEKEQALSEFKQNIENANNR